MDVPGNCCNPCRKPCCCAPSIDICGSVNALLGGITNSVCSLANGLLNMGGGDCCCCKCKKNPCECREHAHHEPCREQEPCRNHDYHGGCCC